MLTDCDLSNLSDDPRELQKFMALNVTAKFHGLSVAKIAQADSSNLVAGVQNKAEAVPELSLAKIKFPVKAFYLLSSLGLCPSSSEARRKIQGGGVRLNGEKIIDPNFQFLENEELIGKVLQLGKKIFRRLSK